MEEIGYYEDPERYDAEYAFLSADTGWYKSRVQELGGPALVLGCGTGRILFHLAAAGVHTDGLDSSPAMLDQARSRAVHMQKEITERVELFEGDMRAFSLPHRYGVVVCPLNGLMHLPNDDDFLMCMLHIREHLAEDGRFLFDVGNPQPELLEEYGEGQGVPVREIRVRGVTYQVREKHIFDHRERISETVFTYEPRGTESPSFRCHLRLRMFEPADIDRLLNLAGFEIIERLGSFMGQPFDEGSPTQIVVARPAAVGWDG